MPQRVRAERVRRIRPDYRTALGKSRINLQGRKVAELHGTTLENCSISLNAPLSKTSADSQ